MIRHSLQSFLTASALAVMALAALPAHAARLSQVVIFGDSLSDSGNNFAAGAYDPTQVILGNFYVPTNTYDQGPFPTGVYSNGPVWASYFAGALGLSAIPSVIPGLNGTTSHSAAPPPPATRRSPASPRRSACSCRAPVGRPRPMRCT